MLASSLCGGRRSKLYSAFGKVLDKVGSGVSTKSLPKDAAFDALCSDVARLQLFCTSFESAAQKYCAALRNSDAVGHAAASDLRALYGEPDEPAAAAGPAGAGSAAGAGAGAGALRVVAERLQRHHEAGRSTRADELARRFEQVLLPTLQDSARTFADAQLLVEARRDALKSVVHYYRKTLDLDAEIEKAARENATVSEEQAARQIRNREKYVGAWDV